MTSFNNLSEDEVIQLIHKATSKSSELDPLATHLFNQHTALIIALKQPWSEYLMTCLQIWTLYYGLPDSLIQKLQHAQNAADHLVCQVKQYDHITPVLKSLHWLPVKHRIEFKILLITFKAMNWCAPTYISSLLKQYIPSGSLWSDSHLKLFSVPKIRYKSFGVGYSV